MLACMLVLATGAPTSAYAIHTAADGTEAAAIDGELSHDAAEHDTAGHHHGPGCAVSGCAGAAVVADNRQPMRRFSTQAARARDHTALGLSTAPRHRPPRTAARI